MSGRSRLASSSPRYRNPRVKPAWYATRQRSITQAQKRAEKRLWPTLGLAFSYNAPLDLGQAFGRDAPTVLEIGCGAGEALTALASARPDTNFLGVDWFRSGLATCCSRIEELGLSNVRLVKADAATLLERGLPDRTPLFDEALIFFPDPWAGSDDRKMVRADVIDDLSRRMRPNGILHVATDVAGYPDHVRGVMSTGARASQWTPIDSTGRWRPSTRYEREGLAAGRTVEDLCFAFTADDAFICDHDGHAAAAESDSESMSAA